MQKPHQRGGTGRSVTGSDHSARRTIEREVLKEFRVIVGSMRKHYARIEAVCGISGAQLWALAQIVSEPGIRVAALGHALAIHQTTASNLVDRLVRGRLIRRVRADPDQRVVRLFPTSHAHRTIARAPKPLDGLLPDALARMPKEVVVRLRRDLATLAAALHIHEVESAAIPLARVLGARQPRVASARAGRAG
jgi:DNA-binding MarR family transcriptional regulator